MAADVLLYANERMDDLLNSGLKIIQSRDVFSFSMDAVLLANWAPVTFKGRIIDICSGNGVIPILLSARTRASITGLEIQERLVDMANRSIQTNGLGEQIQMIQGDLKEAPKWLGTCAFDIVTVNPPYLPRDAGEANLNRSMALARHELACTLREVLHAASRLVKVGGRVAMIHRPSRLAEIMTEMKHVRLEPKKIRFVHPRPGEAANMVYIEAKRDAQPDTRVLSPFFVYRQDGSHTDEFMEIYYGKPRG
jgi:tRNA1(Val) A37 N6-methylase TrmN6